MALVLSIAGNPHKSARTAATYAVVLFTILVHGLTLRIATPKLGFGDAAPRAERSVRLPGSA